MNDNRPCYSYNGTNTTADSIAFTVSDGTGGTTPRTRFDIAVGGINDPPEAAPQSVATNEDVALPVTLSATDPEGSAITQWRIVTSPAHGTLTGTPPAYSYQPSNDFSGSDSFTFQAYDGQEWSSAATVSITVNPVNDAPRWSQSSADAAGVKELKPATFNFSSYFSGDPESNTVTFNKKSGAGTVSSSAQTWSHTFALGDGGQEFTCVITATDNGTPAASSEFTLNISVADSTCRITASVSGGSGTVQLSPAGPTYDPGTSVTVTAVPATRNIFRYWHQGVGTAGSKTRSVTITLGTDTTMSADFFTVPALMKEIAAAGKTFSMGDTISTGGTPIVVGPVHQVTFSYNFWMDSSEVTKRDFSDLLYVDPSWNSSYGEEYPANHISYYVAMFRSGSRPDHDFISYYPIES